MHQQLNKLDQYMKTVDSDLDFLFDASGSKNKIEGMKIDIEKVEETNPIQEVDSERKRLRLDSAKEVYQDLKPPPENDHSYEITERKPEVIIIDEDAKPSESVTSSSLLAKHNANIARLAESFGIYLNETEQTGLAKL